MMMSPTGIFVLAAVAMYGVVFALLLRQCRKPSRVLGRLFLSLMKRMHAGVTAWGLSHVHIAPGVAVLDVGCGGGHTLATFANNAPDVAVFGVDYSAESVATARRINASSIMQGRVTVEQACVSQLPFAAATFDLVTAVETHYYWPNLSSDVQEIWRVLRPGGRVALIAATYRGRDFDFPFRLSMALVRGQYLTASAHRALLATNGFVDVEVHTEPSKGWLCAVGSRPA